MNAAIKNALRHKGPEIIVVNVTMDTLAGRDVVVFRDRIGSRGDRPVFVSDMRETLEYHKTHEGWASEGRAYRHQYHCAADVPADIAAALHSN